MAGAPPIDRHIDGERGARLDRVVVALAERQHGVVARRQLTDLGLGRGVVEVGLRRGRLHLVHRGVYAVGHRRLSREGRLMAAVLACGPDAALSHRSAAGAWGILSHPRSWPEVTRATGWRARNGILQRRSPLPGDEVTVVDGIPSTTVPRTVLDLAAVVSRRQLENALNEIEVRRMTDRLSVPDLLIRYPGRPGSAVLREIFSERAATRGVTRHELEERFACLLEGTDLPKPRRNANIAVASRFFEVDCLWPRQRLIVELDGRAVHGTVRAFERDRERDRLLVADGWRVVRVTWRQLRDDAPSVLADLRALLRTPPPRPTL